MFYRRFTAWLAGKWVDIRRSFSFASAALRAFFAESWWKARKAYYVRFGINLKTFKTEVPIRVDRTYRVEPKPPMTSEQMAAFAAANLARYDMAALGPTAEEGVPERFDRAMTSDEVIPFRVLPAATPPASEGDIAGR
jgi:hypothetical protein